MKRKLKLYVWHEVRRTWMKHSVIFALAPNVDEARRLIIKQEKAIPGDRVYADLLAEPKVYQTPVGFAILGVA